MRFRLISTFGLFIILAQIVTAQSLVDNFSDNDFTTNPTWIGSTNAFKVENQQLQLFTSGSGSAFLQTQALWKDTCTWEIWLKLDFSPSATNKLRIWLSADNLLSSTNLNGYFLEVGETGNDDTWRLYLSENGNTTLLATAPLATMSANSNSCRIKVERYYSGEWVLWADYSGGQNFTQQFSVVNNQISEGRFFGVVCSFTSTRADKFFFDDVAVSPLFVDVEAPKVELVRVENQNEIVLIFNEPIVENSATNPLNYNLKGENPNQLTQTASNSILLKFQTAFGVNQQEILNIDGVKDLAGNEIKNLNVPFMYAVILAGDLVINEIMADPTPVIGLPNEEFIEIYNTTNREIDLSIVRYKDASSQWIELPKYALKAKEYVVLCASGKSALFGILNIAELSSWPALNNGGDALTLESKGRIIDKVTYDLSYYGSSSKSDGGYTLERKNPYLKCSASGNWTASDDANGGTPGKQNSVYSNAPDVTPAKVKSYFFIGSNELALVLSEPIDSANSTALEASVASEKGVLQKIAAFSLDTIFLRFASSFEVNTFYDLKLSGIFDCEGNQTDTLIENLVKWQAQPPKSFDLILTEIMADPDPSFGLPPVEYLEFYNRADYPIDLEGYTLYDNTGSVTFPTYILPPRSFLVIGSSSSVSYFEDVSTLAISGFITLNNSGEYLLLSHQNTEIAPLGYDYKLSWYGDSEKEDGGYSLEMLDFNNPCGGGENWSAALEGVYGTPGKENSVKANTLNSERLRVMNYWLNTPNSIQILFNKPIVLYPEAVLEIVPQNIQLLFTEVNRDTLVVYFSDDLDSNSNYAINLSSQTDCSGLAMKDTILELEIPKIPRAFDLVINEILFNQPTGGSDFIELHNRSEKKLDLRHLQLANSNEKGEFSNIKKVGFRGLVLQPGQKATFTKDKDWTLGYYTVAQPDSLYFSDLPSMNNSDGHLVVLYRDKILDELKYDEDWHFVLLKVVKGVSLERISYNSETQNPSNWQSASTSSGYATPTAKNSQATVKVEISSEVEVLPNTFSPDGDGFEDFTQIHILNNEEGTTASISIYNISGQLVRSLVPNVLLGKENVFKWDGVNDYETKVPVGVYIIRVEMLSLSGKVSRFKKGVVVSTIN